MCQAHHKLARCDVDCARLMPASKSKGANDNGWRRIMYLREGTESGLKVLNAVPTKSRQALLELFSTDRLRTEQKASDPSSGRARTRELLSRMAGLASPLCGGVDRDLLMWAAYATTSREAASSPHPSSAPPG